ncbi:hypothetical protein BT93_L1291 [Corymbia citriodora subsp. variegata]|uniref:NB-ARC domain-containing protein n=1 Tax=Corymbia citriodora subsp. variegata TaxID=360336 RepID=A0A8T0CQK9_CORYI|nr:hypothetical protein BT93_L1291 [Corymbia citriodora subsp. variegata]
MAKEIGDFLLEKLKKELQPKDGKRSKIAFSGCLQELTTLIEGNRKSSTRDEKSIRDILYALNNFLTECQSLSMKQIIAKVQICKSPKRIRKDLKKIPDQITGGSNNTPKGNTDESSSNGNDSFLQVSGQSQHLQKFEGFEVEIELLESLVQKESAEQFKAIAIVGSGGIGKTTLCWLFFDKEAEKEIKKSSKKVENQKTNEEESMQKLNKEEKMKKPNKEEEQKYCPRIWVNMSRQPDEDPDQKVAIIKRMLTHLGVEEKTIAARDLSGIVSLLHQQLWGKKYLIVLDNVRGHEEWYYDLCSRLVPGSNWGDRLAYGFPKGYGGTVIVTSRNEELAMRMVGEENLHRMMPLSDGVCWSIFQDSAKEGRTLDEKLKGEVYSKCAGIPLAAKVMGQINNKQPQEEPANIANSA